MPDAYTPNLNLDMIAAEDTDYVERYASTLAYLDTLTALGSLAVASVDMPNDNLNIKVAAGSFRKADGTLVVYAGTASQAVTAATTNYVYLDDSATLHVNTTGFPTNCVRLATVLAGPTNLLSIADARVPWTLVGVGTPTIAGGTGAGSSPTATVAGNDRAGVITVFTGSGPTGSAVVATVTFSAAFGATPKAILLTPAGPNSAALSGAGAVYLDSASTTTAHFVLKVGSSALAATTTYLWHYHVLP